NILGSLHSTNGVNSFISEALEGESDSPLERNLYIGSFGYPYILRLVIRKPAIDLASSLTASAAGRAQAMVNLNEPLASMAATRSIGYSPIISPIAGSQLLFPFNATGGIPAVLSTWSQFHRLAAPFSLS